MAVDKNYSEAAAEIFFPYYNDKLQKARQEKFDFVHYTSADVACSIIDNSSIWLRNARLMNDFGEVRHGRTCLDYALEKHEDSFYSILDEISPNISQRVKNALSNLLHSQIENTYLLSLSEHGSAVSDEDKYGRLSMWRAYGGENNVAIVIRSQALLDNNATFNAFGSPVLYADREKFAEHLFIVTMRMRQNLKYLQSQSENDVQNSIIRALHFAVLSTKHPGFSEEREWRILYCPNIWCSDFLEEFHTSISGIPQRAYRLPFKNSAQNGLEQFELKDLIKKIIIGPNEFPQIIYQTLVDKLRLAGVPSPESLVTASTIPLRRW